MELPAEDRLRWIVRSYAQLRAAYGAAIGMPELVQPTGHFFPDEFRGDAPSVARLLARMIEYSPLPEGLGIELGFVEGESGSEGGYGSRACGTKGGAVRSVDVVERDDGYRVVLVATDVANPEVLAASLARTVGALVRLEERIPDATNAASLSAEKKQGDRGGVRFRRAARQRFRGRAKSCGGLRWAPGVAIRRRDRRCPVSFRGHRRHKGLGGSRAPGYDVQREALDHALAWTESNPLLVETL